MRLLYLAMGAQSTTMNGLVAILYIDSWRASQACLYTSYFQSQAKDMLASSYLISQSTAPIAQKYFLA